MGSVGRMKGTNEVSAVGVAMRERLGVLTLKVTHLDGCEG